MPKGQNQKAKLLHLAEITLLQPVFLNQTVDSITGNIFLQTPFLLRIHRQQFRNWDANLPESLIIPQFRGQFVAKLIIIAGFMVNLLQNIFPFPIGDQIGISALSFAQQPENPVFCFIDIHGFHA